jgi:hypothetical protein
VEDPIPAQYPTTPTFNRLCDNCHNSRVPEVRHTKKGSHYWTIFKCRICGRQDIEAQRPRKIWTGNFFEDEYDNDESISE